MSLSIQTQNKTYEIHRRFEFEYARKVEKKKKKNTNFLLKPRLSEHC